MQKFALVFLALVLYILLWLGIVAIPIAITGGDVEAALVIVLATLVLFPITLSPLIGMSILPCGK